MVEDIRRLLMSISFVVERPSVQNISWSVYGNNLDSVCVTLSL